MLGIEWLRKGEVDGGWEGEKETENGKEGQA